MSVDAVIVEFDKALRAVFAPAPTCRAIPGAQEVESDMSPEERRNAAALMRVNHCGEICAQALYQGQALTADNPQARQALEHAAWEETEHLAWTERRIVELGGRKSLLNPLWYVGSLVLGGLAGKAGNAWNLGFLAETERQVEAHLTSHLQRLPPKDLKSRAVLEQMKLDEISHAQTALSLGGRNFPLPVPQVMSLVSKIMTKTAYYL
jgi:ubiquinone biosynthesis monooxygenase Coq7